MSESQPETKADTQTEGQPESFFKPEISFDEFAKVDLRVAVITEAEFHPNADRLLKLQLDDGSGTPRQICAGIKGHYEPGDLVGKRIIIVANLALGRSVARNRGGCCSRRAMRRRTGTAIGASCCSPR